MKLLLHSGFASHYRTPIYRLIGETIGCTYCFGDKPYPGDVVKKIDYSELKGDVKELKNIYCAGYYYQHGVLKLLFDKFDTYVMGMDTRCLSTWSFLLAWKIFVPYKRVYAWTHGMRGNERGLKLLMYKILFKLLTGSFVYNERSVKIMVERGIPANKLYTIYNSLDYDKQLQLRESLIVSPLFQMHFDNTNRNIVFIGRLTKVKRFDLLINAVALLKERGEMVNVTFIGDGVERRNMEVLVEEKGIKNQVWFYGECYDEKTNAELIYNADLCVSPGNIGLTAMHVLMFGCPAITNDDFDHQMPEFDSIHEGLSGAFYKAYDSSSLADAISKWFAIHKDDREEVRKACYKEIDSKWNPHVQIEIFKKVLIG